MLQSLPENPEMQKITEQQLEALCEKLSLAMVNALQQSRSVSEAEHYDHHLWVSQRIERDRARTKFWQAMFEHVMKWGAVSVVSCVFYAVWLYLKHELKN